MFGLTIAFVFAAVFYGAAEYEHMSGWKWAIVATGPRGRSRTGGCARNKSGARRKKPTARDRDDRSVR